MKASIEKAAFKPITLVLETREEVALLYYLLDNTYVTDMNTYYRDNKVTKIPQSVKDTMWASLDTIVTMEDLT